MTGTHQMVHLPKLYMVRPGETMCGFEGPVYEGYGWGQPPAICWMCWEMDRWGAIENTDIRGELRLIEYCDESVRAAALQWSD